MKQYSIEAQKLYYALFDKKIPSCIETYFASLTEKIDRRFSQEEIDKYFNCLKKVNDIEALELAARHLKKLPILTVKIKTMLYLAETQPENYNEYINEENERCHAYILLICAVFRSSYKLAKGFVLLKVHKV